MTESPRYALNTRGYRDEDLIVCYPQDDYPLDIVTGILRGGLEKMEKADVALVGGHTIRDPELKYGVAVTGTINPDRIITNAGARVGDLLVLTKRLGVGVVTTAIKKNKALIGSVREATESMLRLNRNASEIMRTYNARAATGVWKSNREAVDEYVSFGNDVARELKHILFEAETSGGLFITFPPDKAEKAVAELHADGDMPAVVVGRATDGAPGSIAIV